MRAEGLTIALLLTCRPAEVFVCSTNTQCTRDGEQGFCQPAHFCSFPDAQCPSRQRYVPHAAPALAGQCVGADLTTALAVRWGFDEGSGKVTADTAGGDAEGELLSGLANNWDAGVWGPGLAFDGDNDRLEAPTGRAVFGDRSFSFALWVNSRDDGGVQGRLLGRSFDENAYFFLNWGDGKPVLESADSAVGHWNAGVRSKNIADGTWHHVGIVVDRDAGVTRAYLDGEYEAEYGTVSTGRFGLADAGPILLGAMFDGRPDVAWSGRMDEVWIYERALGEPEMKALFEGPALASPPRR